MTTTYYVRVGKYKEYLHVETEGREGITLGEALAEMLLPDEKQSDARTAKVRFYKLPPIENAPTTVKLGIDSSSNQYKLNEVNVGGFR